MHSIKLVIEQSRVAQYVTPASVDGAADYDESHSVFSSWTLRGARNVAFRKDYTCLHLICAFYVLMYML